MEWTYKKHRIELSDSTGRFRAVMGEDEDDKSDWYDTKKQAEEYITRNLAKAAGKKRLDLPVMIDGQSCTITGFNRNNGQVRGEGIPQGEYGPRYHQEAYPDDERVREIQRRYDFYRRQLEAVKLSLYGRGRIQADHYDGVLRSFEENHTQVVALVDQLVIEYDPKAETPGGGPIEDDSSDWDMD